MSKGDLMRPKKNKRNNPNRVSTALRQKEEIEEERALRLNKDRVSTAKRSQLIIYKWRMYVGLFVYLSVCVPWMYGVFFYNCLSLCNLPNRFYSMYYIYDNTFNPIHIFTTIYLSSQH